MSGELPARGMQDRCGGSRTDTGGRPGKAAGKEVLAETGRYYKRQHSGVTSVNKLLSHFFPNSQEIRK